MQLYRFGPAQADPESVGLHLAVGIFDGVHCGHQRVLQSAKAAAEADGGLAGLLTFDPHPSRILRPDMATRLMMPLEQRIEYLRDWGLDCVAVRTFTRDFSLLDGQGFIDSLQAELPGIKSLHVGENFRFGHRRAADAVSLAGYAKAKGIGVRIISRQLFEGEPVSSSRIRGFVESGQMQQVSEMFGRPYEIRGHVISGRRLGRTMGFPTLNIQWNPELKPPFGVYAALVRWPKSGAAEGLRFNCVANYGVRPTVESAGAPLLELHLLDQAPPADATGLLVTELHQMLRPEMRFSGLEQLRQQISADVEAARRYFSTTQLPTPFVPRSS